MTFEILNVEHGFCAYAVGSDGGVLLFDCGHSEMNRPSVYLPARGIISHLRRALFSSRTTTRTTSAT